MRIQTRSSTVPRAFAAIIASCTAPSGYYSFIVLAMPGMSAFLVVLDAVMLQSRFAADAAKETKKVSASKDFIGPPLRE